MEPHLLIAEIKDFPYVESLYCEGGEEGQSLLVVFLKGGIDSEELASLTRLVEQHMNISSRTDSFNAALPTVSFSGTPFKRK